METFNLTSYENGRVIKTIKAETMQDAKNILELKGYDCQDDYFLESVTERNRWDMQNINGRTIYIDEIR
jgi:hypothetical protein